MSIDDPTVIPQASEQSSASGSPTAPTSPTGPTPSATEFERNFAVVRRTGSDARTGDGSRPAPTVSVVIPAKNEAKNLPHVLAALPGGLHEVILVDGDSTDDTIAVARACFPDIVVIGQTRKGKGNALACGFAAATGDFIVMIDADGSTDPAEIPTVRGRTAPGCRLRQGLALHAGCGQQRHQPAAPDGELLAQQDRQPPVRDALHGPLLRLQRLPPRLPQRAGAHGRVAGRGPTPARCCGATGSRWRP